MTEKPREYTFTGRLGYTIRIVVRPAPQPPLISVAAWNMASGEANWALVWAELSEAFAKIEAMERRAAASARGRRNRTSHVTNAEVQDRWQRYVAKCDAAGKRATLNSFAKTKPFGLRRTALYSKIPKSER